MVSPYTGAVKMPPPFVVCVEIQDGAGVGEEAAGCSSRDRRPHHGQRPGGGRTQPVVK